MNTPLARIAVRIRPLPRRHRIAHLRALIRLSSPRPARRLRLARLLRDELAAQAGWEGGLQ